MRSIGFCLIVLFSLVSGTGVATAQTSTSSGGAAACSFIQPPVVFATCCQQNPNDPACSVTASDCTIWSIPPWGNNGLQNCCYLNPSAIGCSGISGSSSSSGGVISGSSSSSSGGVISGSSSSSSGGGHRSECQVICIPGPTQQSCCLIHPLAVNCPDHNQCSDCTFVCPPGPGQTTCCAIHPLAVNCPKHYFCQ